MNYIDQIFERANIQHMREYLLHGGDLIEIDTRSYFERLKAPEKIMEDMLRSKFPDEEEYNDAANKIYDYVCATQEVYIEIGMQAGI